MDMSFIISSFIAGLLTFLAPCTLPLVPAYLGMLSGASLNGQKNTQTKSSQSKKGAFTTGIFFVVGFSIIFILLGALAGVAGSIIGPYRVWMERLSGILVILFGLMMLDMIRIPFLSQERRVNLSRFLTQKRNTNAFILGSAFALGWTPCIGPVLGTILLLASNTGTVLQGTLLLFVFSIGLAIPFLLIAFFIDRASLIITELSSVTRAVSVVGGIFLIVLGSMLLSGTTGYLITLSFELLRFINYDTLLNYL